MNNHTLPWIRVCPNAPYFETETGQIWTPVGQNDAINWPDFAGAFRRRDMASVEGHLRFLADHNVTCLRLMMEYCQFEHRYLEKPVGRFVPNMIALWDDIFALCEKYHLRILLTPYDTFWMWIRWAKHPYNSVNGGIIEKRERWLLEPQMRDAIKHRLDFATERWGASGALFAWDLWNEINPAHAEKSVEPFWDFIAEIGDHLRATELRVHGRAHPQTVSTYGAASNFDAGVAAALYRHPTLDFASIHFYERAALDNPKNTVDSAKDAGELTREALGEIRDNRPFFDSEHGPIHAFKDKKKILPQPFDDEYFRTFQWTHLASGGVGGGLRWPNRHPHVLTHGMRAAQRSLSEFLPLIDWGNFQRRNLNEEIQTDAPCATFGCGDENQAVVYFLRTDALGKSGMIKPNAPSIEARVEVPGLGAGRYKITVWDTLNGCAAREFEAECARETPLIFEVALQSDVAVAIRRAQ